MDEEEIVVFKKTESHNDMHKEKYINLSDEIDTINNDYNCKIENNIITLKGTVLSMNGMESITKELKKEYNSSVNIGIDLANLILNSGGDKILAETRSL